MAARGRAVSEATLGAWLLKASPAGLAVDHLVRHGFASVTSRCVRPSYRTDLVRAGQPVLLWISGSDARLPAGLHAAGHTRGPVQTGDELSMPVSLRAIDPPVTREEIRAHPGLASIEVLRMPAGSNPSYLDLEQYGALVDAFPQLAVD